MSEYINKNELFDKLNRVSWYINDSTDYNFKLISAIINSCEVKNVILCKELER